MSAQHQRNLRPFREGDTERLIGWIGSEKELLEWAGPSFRYPLSAGNFRQHLKTHQSERFHPLCLVDEETDRLCAYGEVHVSPGCVPVAADLSRIIVEPVQSRGHGFGERFVKQLVRFCVEDLGLTRVGLNVYTHNEPAIRCYKKAGFQEEGCRRHVVRYEGVDWDSYMMSVLKTD